MYQTIFPSKLEYPLKLSIQAVVSHIKHICTMPVHMIDRFTQVTVSNGAVDCHAMLDSATFVAVVRGVYGSRLCKGRTRESEDTECSLSSNCQLTTRFKCNHSYDIASITSLWQNKTECQNISFMAQIMLWYFSLGHVVINRLIPASITY